MPLDENANAPNSETVLFHLTLFLEFCEAYEADEFCASIPCECLRDAVEELCRSLTMSAFTSHEQSALVTALHQSENAFLEAMPELHGKTGAARGFSALTELLNSAADSEKCFARESRSAALGVAHRFGRTLGTFVGSWSANTTHHGQNDRLHAHV